ncbi:MAG: hypothetical protein KC445_09585 [Anaerolineales bacterium]|nr:hypothetical protein [Anaerolineales bacterium]
MKQANNETQETLEKAQELTANMLAITKPEAIFGAPVEIDGKRVVVASEVGAAMGVGQVWQATGGGGTSQDRPVAVISVRDGRVRIRPVFDFTKIGLALLTAVASFATMWRKLRTA